MGRKSRTRNRRKTRKTKRIWALLFIVAMIISMHYITNTYLDSKAMIDIKNGKVPEYVKQDFIEKGGKARPGKSLKKIKGIVIHYVANSGTSAEANRDYFNKADTKVSAHFIVGLKGEIIQCVPLFEQAVASNERNVDTVSIEVCHPDSSGKFSNTTMRSLINLTNWLVEAGRLERYDVIRHYDITGKLCPKYYVEHKDAWEAFKSQIQ